MTIQIDSQMLLIAAPKAPGLIGYLLSFCLLLSGCATTGGPGEERSADLLEPVNRPVYKFNSTVDTYVIKPVANAYTFVTPGFVQTGVSNFFTNLNNINVVVNDLLQAKFVQGAADTTRFAVNSTVGIGGLFDVAKYMGLEQNDEDFDQTLGVWGVPAGPYIVLPLVGPTHLRRFPSYAVDSVTNPMNYIFPPVSLVRAVDDRARAEGALKFIDEAALDPYVFTRESYLQWREHLVHDGEPPTDDFDDFDFNDEFDAPENADAAPATVDGVYPVGLETVGEEPAAARDGGGASAVFTSEPDGSGDTGSSGFQRDDPERVRSDYHRLQRPGYSSH